MAKDGKRLDNGLAVIAQLEEMEINISGIVGVGMEHASDVSLAGVYQVGISAGNARFAGDIVSLWIGGVKLTGEIPGFTTIPADAAADSRTLRIVIAVGAENGAGMESQQLEVRAFEWG